MGVSFIPIILTVVILVESLYLPEVTPPGIANGTGEEIQHAICKISSKDLEATANATVIRELKGVCTSVELQTHLDQIQSKILEELNVIQHTLRENGFKIPQVQRQSFIDTPENLQPVTIGYRYVSEELQLKSITEKPFATRFQEINTFNDTVRDSHKGNIYFYYWNVENVENLLRKKEMYISSPEFFVLGHSVHLQLYPHYLDEKSCAIQMRPLSKGFVKKHTIYIMNQVDKSLDIDSGLMFGFKEESVFTVSEEIVHEFGYIHNGDMVVKLEIFLNS